MIGSSKLTSLDISHLYLGPSVHGSIQAMANQVGPDEHRVFDWFVSK